MFFRAKVTSWKLRKNNDNDNDNDNFFSFYANITRFLIVLRTRNLTNDDENDDEDDDYLNEHKDKEFQR